MTLRVDGTVRDLIAALGAHGLAVSIPAIAEEMPYTAHVREQTIDSVLLQLAERIGPDARVLQRQGYVFVGQPRDTDLQVATFHVPHGQAEQWLALYRLAASSSAEVEALDDLLVVRDRADGLRRARAFHQSAAGSRRQYEVEVVFALLSQLDADALGVRLDASGLSRVAFTVDAAGEGITLEAAIQGQLRGRGQSVGSSSVETAVLRLVEGQPRTIASETRIPFRTRSVNDSGVIVDSGVETLNAGLSVEVSVTASSDELARVDLAATLSSVDRIVDDLPVISSRTVDTAAIVGDGGCVVVGGLEARSHSSSWDRLPFARRATGRDRDRDERRAYIFASLREVSGDFERPALPGSEPSAAWVDWSKEVSH